MIALGNAPGHVQVKGLIIAFISGNDPFHQTPPFGIRMWILQADAVQAVLQALQMIGQTKRLARVNRNDFIHAIAKNEAPVQHGNARFIDGYEITVQINHMA
jgi:predicted RNA methylase